MTDAALKPCPFCGAAMKYGQEPSDNHPVAGLFYMFHEGPTKCPISVAPHYSTVVEMADAWNARPSPKVRKLVWDDEDGGCFVANGCGKLYRILHRIDGSASLRHAESRFNESKHETLEAAKAAAQADYEARILGALE